MPCKSGRRRKARVPTTGLARPDLSGRRTDLWRLGRRLDAEPTRQRTRIRPGSGGRRRSSLRDVGRVRPRAYPGYRSVALGACVGRTHRGTRPLSHVLRRTRSSPGVDRCATHRSRVHERTLTRGPHLRRSHNSEEQADGESSWRETAGLPGVSMCELVTPRGRVFLGHAFRHDKRPGVLDKVAHFFGIDRGQADVSPVIAEVRLARQ